MIVVGVVTVEVLVEVEAVVVKVKNIVTMLLEVARKQ